MCPIGDEDPFSHGRDATNEFTATKDFPKGMIASGTTYDGLRHLLRLTEYQK